MMMMMMTRLGYCCYHEQGRVMLKDANNKYNSNNGH